MSVPLPRITHGLNILFYIDVDGRVSAWGNNTERLRDIPADLPPIIQVVSTADYAIALCHNGTLRAWGTGSAIVNTSYTNLHHITAKFGITKDGKAVRLVPFKSIRYSMQTPEGKFRSKTLKDLLPKKFISPVIRIWEINDYVYLVHADNSITSWQESITHRTRDYFDAPEDLAQLKDVTQFIKLYQDGHIVGWNDQRMIDAVASIPHHDFVSLNSAYALRATGELVQMPSITHEEDPKTAFNDDDEINTSDDDDDDDDEIIMTQDTNVPMPSHLTDVIQCESTGWNTVALTRDGRIAIWGEKSDTLNPPLPVNDPTIVEIAATRGMVVIRYANGSVKIWDNEFHSFDDFIEPGEANIISVGASLRYSGDQWYRQYIALDDQGNVHTDDHSWELEFEENYIAPEENGYITPAAVQGNTTAVFATDRNFYAVLKDATKVYGWGGRSIRPIKSPKPVTQIAGNGDTLAILYHDGTVRVNRKEGFEPPAHLGPVKSIAASDTHILALLKDGTVVAWGDNELGACDVPADLGPVVQVAVGDDFSVVLCADGSVRSWGENGEGQYAFPADLPNVRQISTSFYETYVLTESGSVIKSHRPSIFDVPDALRV